MPFNVPSQTTDGTGSAMTTEEAANALQYENFFGFFAAHPDWFSDSLILFHGGQDPVAYPSAYKNDPRKKRDFGDGFYTTYDVDQANRWALRKKEESGYGAVSVYEYTGELTGRVFPEEPSPDWLEFVVECRRNKCRHSEYDIIEGPVADDDVATTVNQYIEGAINQSQALEQIAYFESSHQMVFTNEAATPHLQFLGWWDI